MAIYLGNATDFPTDTSGTTTNLIDAVCYSKSNSILPTALMTALNKTTFVNENQGSAAATKSMQRKNDGTFEVKLPTPGVNNDGTGETFNGVTLSVTSGVLTEGNSFTVTFTTQTAVTGDLTIPFSLTNGSFTTADFSGTLSVFIPQGNTTGTTNILLIDDTLNEGDEIMKIAIGSLANPYVKQNDNVEYRIRDNDFIIRPWGTPLNPTFGSVTSTVPTNYYASLEGKSGSVLRQALQDIIANPAVVRKQNYGDVIDILKEADENPTNSGEVWLMYVEQPRSKIDFQTGTSGAAGFWNREHIYCQSRGGFTNGTSNDPNGIDNWEPTNADDILAGHADAHHLRAEDSPENSLRNERNYGVDYNGPAGNQGSWHGDVARAVFYMCVRYNGLEVVNGNPPQNPDGFIGDLATLLQWNFSDPSDDFEMNRNNIVYNWQQNRNPFIDYPQLANYIWGPNVGQPWFATPLSTDENATLQVGLYPNPAKDQITISGLSTNGSIEIFNMSGMRLYQSDFSGDTTIQLNLSSGMYLTKITSENKTAIKKLLIK